MSLLDQPEDLSAIDLQNSALIAMSNHSSSTDSSADHKDVTDVSDSESSDIDTAFDTEALKREAQQAVFDRHLQSQPKPVKEERKPIFARDGGAEEEVTDPDSTRIIDRVRDYQQELFERAKEENIIAVLDTGSGKTLIACLLIRHVLEQERIDRAEGQRPRIVCFLANSVHLVQQQGRVLANNLIESPAVLHGNTKLDLWSRTVWERIKEHNMITVSTPAILDQALAHSYLRIQDISLLVFDEAHHAKKDHPYSRLIRSYYLKCPAESKPKIFGMTASAVDTKGDIAQTATALEELLHAKIVTTEDGSLLSFAPKPTDVQWIYDRPRPHFATDLHRTLLDTVSFCGDLKRGFEFAKKATTELGPWCADRAWTFVFGASEHQSSSIPRKYEQSDDYAEIEPDRREEVLSVLNQAAHLVQEAVFEVPQLAPTHLSSKVIELHKKLSEHYKQQPNTRAIVFVEERLKALVLNECFKLLSIPTVRTGTLIGIAGTSFEATSVKEQEKTLQHFRAGLVNLVFATSVADEGLDIPQCNLCVRFDLCKTTIQYMQSRGRARMRGSFFAHMIEDGKFDHTSDLQYQIDTEQYLKQWCSELAPDRKLGHGTQLAKLLAKDEGGRSFKTETGAVCDNSNALLILARFAASLAHTGATEKEIYSEEIDVEKNLFRYIIRLPANIECAVVGCRGDWKTSKQLAKRSAAWATCFLLRKKGHLDDNFDSIYRKIKPENANAHLAVSSKKSAYDMQIKPSVWEEHVGTVPTQLFATVVRFQSEKALRHKLAPIVVLTRAHMPRFPTFPTYPEEDVTVDVVSESITSPFAVTQEELQRLTAFTLDGVFADVFNKVYSHELESITYWLAPLRSLGSTNTTTLADIIDLEAVTSTLKERLRWQPGMSADLWANKFWCDPLNGKFHYFTGDVVPEAKPTDDNLVGRDGKFNISQKRQQGTILEFSDSTWTATKKKVAAANAYDLEQPVFTADLTGMKRNFLDPAIAKGYWTPCLVCPQTLQVARIDAEFAASCVLWPVVIHRMESYMIVLEAFDKLGLKGVSAELALEAFTKDADNEEEEVQTHTGGKRGMGKNYERLEFIGDSLLKMTTTMTVYNRTTCDEEGMHCRRMEILCNRNLFNVATSHDMQLFRYARTLGFDRTTWYPEHLKLLSGRGAKKEPEPNMHPPMTQALGMKTIADMSEAIIGAAITSTKDLPPDNHRFDLGIQAITTLVRSDDHAVTSWSDMATRYKPQPWSLRHDDPVANDRARIIATKTGYTFKHPRLLRSAFTHSSDTNSPVPDLQRLEFLGDAVLDWVCISWLYNTNPTRNPQWLTEHKMAMVSNKFLAALAVTLDFDKLIFVTTAKLIADIQTYATKVRETMALPDCPKSFWTDIESPPKALSDLIESYLGALLVDSNFNYSEMETFFTNHVQHFFTNISDYDAFANRHPTTFFYNKMTHEYKCRDFTIRDSADPNLEGRGIELEIVAGVIIHNKVVADARGTSARYAKVRAAKKALVTLEGVSREEFRERFGCFCAGRGE